MENTHFENATGLQNENHYSTVKDLAVLLQYALQNSTFEEIFCSREHLTAPTDGHPEGLMLRSSMFRLQEDWTVEKEKVRFGEAKPDLQMRQGCVSPRRL